MNRKDIWFLATVFFIRTFVAQGPANVAKMNREVNSFIAGKEVVQVSQSSGNYFTFVTVLVKKEVPDQSVGN